MGVKPIPDGFTTVTPYLAVRGAGAVLEFVQKAFGPSPGVEVTEKLAMPDGTLMHAQVRIGDAMVMVGEAPAQGPASPAMLYLYVTDADEVYARALAAGGTSLREPRDEFYGDRAAGVGDVAGNQWWIATRKENLTQEEMEKRARGKK